MKNGFSKAGQIVALLTCALAIYAGFDYRDQILLFLHNNFTPERKVEEVAKPAPLNPLPAQIAQCRKLKSGYQACMFDAGYEVNPAWTDAHKAAGAGPKAGTASEVVRDPYRAEPSPVYGVPYWAPRQPK